MAQEPQLKRGSAPSNAYVNRWRWWYAAISDHLIADPSATVAQVAAAIGRSAGAVQQIMTTDLFRDYHAQRRQEFQAANDFMLSSKLGKVAEKGLDLLLEVMQKKGDQVPLGQLVEITKSSLEKLGYGAAPGPQVVVNNNASSQTMVPVGAGALAEAREALRRAEQKKLAEPLIAPQVSGPVLDLEALEADDDSGPRSQ